MFWIAVSSLCINMVISHLDRRPEVENRCFQTASISTSPITAKDGEKDYTAFDSSVTKFKITSINGHGGGGDGPEPDWGALERKKDAEEREKRSNPGYDYDRTYIFHEPRKGEFPIMDSRP